MSKKVVNSPTRYLIGVGLDILDSVIDSGLRVLAYAQTRSVKVASDVASELADAEEK